MDVWVINDESGSTNIFLLLNAVVGQGKDTCQRTDEVSLRANRYVPQWVSLGHSAVMIWTEHFLY